MNTPSLLFPYILIFISIPFVALAMRGLEPKQEEKELSQEMVVFIGIYYGIIVWYLFFLFK